MYDTGPIRCTDCGSVYDDGQWHAPSTQSAEGRDGLCSACQRRRDEAPSSGACAPEEFGERAPELLDLLRSLRPERAAEGERGA